MLNLNATVAAAGWLCWPMLAANAPLQWMRFWSEVHALPMFSPLQHSYGAREPVVAPARPSSL
jgi:hypothetical protein